MFIDESSSVMTNLIYGNNGFQMDNMVKDYLINQRHNDVYGLGTGFYDGMLARYNQIQNSEPIRMAKAIYRKMVHGVENYFNDRIVTLDTIGKMQNPPPIMYRYLVANPTVRDLKGKERIVGYSDVYNDPYDVDADIESIPEYRHVMNGIIHKQDGKLIATRYYESANTRSTITPDEQFDIFYSWKNIEHAIASGGDDPTDKDNGSL